MTALVASSASAQATETDFGGLKVRSKPATGTAPAGAFGTPPTGFPLTGSAMAANMLAMCSSVTWVPASTPLPSSRAEQPRADEHPRRGTGGGVVTAQGVGALGRPVTSRPRT